MTGQLFSHGKLILLGEYSVLHGSKAVCLPLATGQKMIYSFNNTREIRWNWTYKNQLIANLVMDYESFELINEEHGNHSWVKALFHLIRQQNSKFLMDKGCELHFTNYFPVELGLGSSSATISSLCRLAGVNPYIVNQLLMGGSGADIACTTLDHWFIFRKMTPLPLITEIYGTYKFENQTCFVYSGKKQQTASHIKMVLGGKLLHPVIINEINSLVDRFLLTDNFSELLTIISEHEQIISKFIPIEPIGSRYSDFNGKLKSLGAWGGDFFMAISPDGVEYITDFFTKNGYNQVFAWNKLVNSEKF